MARKLTVWFLRSFIWGGAVIVALGLTAWAYPPSVLGMIAIVGGSEICPALEVLSGAVLKQKLFDATKELSETARIVTRDADGFELVETSAGQFWLPEGSDEALPILVAQQEVGIYRRGRMDGQVVLDCGAHIGLYAREALRQGAAKVVAIEPSEKNLECLRRNLLKEIAAGKVVVYPKGVWDEETTLTFFEAPRNSAASSFVASSTDAVAVSSVPVTTVDRLAAELDLGRVDVIKMDIKGATARALQGAAGILRRDRPHIVLATEEKEDDAPALIAQLRGFGYSVRCGFCSLGADLKITPDVVFFEPDPVR